MRITFLLVLAVFLVNAVFIRRIRAAVHRERERQAYVSRDLAEVISGIDTVKSHAAEDREVHRVSGTLRNMVDARIRSTMLSAFSEYFRVGTMSLMLIAVIWFGGNDVLAGAMTVGDFVAFAVDLRMPGALHIVGALTGGLLELVGLALRGLEGIAQGRRVVHPAAVLRAVGSRCVAGRNCRGSDSR